MQPYECSKSHNYSKMWEVNVLLNFKLVLTVQVSRDLPLQACQLNDFTEH